MKSTVFRTLSIVLISTAMMFLGCGGPGGGGGGTTTVATPTFSETPDPVANLGNIQQDTAYIVLSTTTVGAAIYYTTDGLTDPTTSSTPYSGPIPVNQFGEGSRELRAFAVLAGSTDSAIATKTTSHLTLVIPTMRIIIR